MTFRDRFNNGSQFSDLYKDKFTYYYTLFLYAIENYPLDKIFSLFKFLGLNTIGLKEDY